jgi:hypothetical protein
MLSYPAHLLTQTEVSLREHDVLQLLKTAARLFQGANQAGKHIIEGGGDPQLSDVLIDALAQMDLPAEEQRALMHILQETRDCMFELQARKDAYKVARGIRR